MTDTSEVETSADDHETRITWLETEMRKLLRLPEHTDANT